MDDKFWEKDEWYRLSTIKEGFGIYSELLNYEPIQLKQVKNYFDLFEKW